MIIILDKDGNISVKESPLQGEGNNLKNLAAFLGNPSDGDAIVYNAESGMWETGKLATLPAVDAEDNGKVLTVVEGVWTAVLPETPGTPETTVDTET